MVNTTRFCVRPYLQIRRTHRIARVFDFDWPIPARLGRYRGNDSSAHAANFIPFVSFELVVVVVVVDGLTDSLTE